MERWNRGRNDYRMREERREDMGRGEMEGNMTPMIDGDGSERPKSGKEGISERGGKNNLC